MHQLGHDVGLVDCRDVNASIARSARIGHDSVIGPFCSIGEETEVG